MNVTVLLVALCGTKFNYNVKWIINRHINTITHRNKMSFWLKFISKSKPIFSVACHNLGTLIRSQYMRININQHLIVRQENAIYAFEQKEREFLFHHPKIDFSF